MAVNLINITNTELKDAIVSVLIGMLNIGSDSYEFGKPYLSSRVIDKDGSTQYKLLSPYSGDLQINGSTDNKNGMQRGVLPFILNSDITSDMFAKLKVNPACNFADGTVDETKLIAYGSHSNTVNDDDSKYGYIQIPSISVDGASRNHSFKQLVWTAGKAIGTFKQYLTGVDICGDITSGVSVYKTYYPQHGWGCNIANITGETQITDGNTYFIDLITGARTEIPADSPLKNIGYPAYYSDVVEIGDYIFFIDTSNYINKIDKSTLTLVSKSSNTYNVSNCNLFKIDEQLYLCEGSSYYNPYLYAIDKDSLNQISVDITSITANLPEYMRYSSNYHFGNKSIHNVGDYYIIYNGDKKFGLTCSDLSDIAGTVIPELCQFNIPKSSYRQLTDTVACLSAYNNNDMTNDLKDETSGILKISMDNGQVLSVAEFNPYFENTGDKEIKLTIAE